MERKFLNFFDSLVKLSCNPDKHLKKIDFKFFCNKNRNEVDTPSILHSFERFCDLFESSYSLCFLSDWKWFKNNTRYEFRTPRTSVYQKLGILNVFSFWNFEGYFGVGKGSKVTPDMYSATSKPPSHLLNKLNTLRYWTKKIFIDMHSSRSIFHAKSRTVFRF